MATSKELRLEQAQESLSMAQKMLARYQSGEILASEVSRILDAATQATQAAAHLNQLVGLLLADLDA